MANASCTMNVHFMVTLADRGYANKKGLEHISLNANVTLATRLYSAKAANYEDSCQLSV